MHDLNWAQTDFMEQSQAFAEKIFADVRLLSQSPAPLTGVTRTSYSPEEGRVLKYLSDVCCGLGLQVETDPAGNVWGTLRGSDPELPAVVSGSHCDSVPDGGNYDGLAGIVAALCTARWMQYLGFSPKRDFRVVIMRGEEEGLLGSLGMLGQLTEDDLSRRMRSGSAGPTLRELLTGIGVDPASVSSGKHCVDFAKIAAFIEVHIEQSARLDNAVTDRVGVVTGIRGLIRHRTIQAIGETAHAGAVDFPYRKDAALACARFSSRLYDFWQHELSLGRDLVATTGVIHTSPSASMNKIAGECIVSLDARSLSVAELNLFEKKVEAILQETAEETGVIFKTDPLMRLAPVEADEGVMKKLETSADILKIGTQRMPSGAGHDAMNFAAAGVPFAMLFVANRFGSHNPNEYMAMDDFLNAAGILARTVMDFDR